MSDEKRTFSRVSLRARGLARRLSSPDEPAWFKGSPTLATAAEVDLLKSAVPNVPEALLAFMNAINNKLDLLLSLVNQERLQHEFPLVVETVEVSGAGLIFESSAHLALQDHLEIVLVLAQFPLTMASGIGTIVRRDQRLGRPQWALEFTTIREVDQETIIRAVFEEQREAIRASKRSTPAPGKIKK
jgi:hypothetical protein